MPEWSSLPSVEMLIVEFDQLWQAPASPGNRRRMDQLIVMIEAFEQMDGAACLTACQASPASQ
jgi:alpha-D-ribose 1-methylphosphonate 5-triphosphate synthase subunit PhnH